MIDSTSRATSDLDRAVALLRSGDHRCVLCRGDETLVSDARGVAPLVDWLAAGTDLTGFSAADRVVGRAAALLYVAAGVDRVHAILASQGASQVFADHQIDFAAERTVPAILNRDRTGSCPMESTVAGIDDPRAAVPALTSAVAAMRAQMANPPRDAPEGR